MYLLLQPVLYDHLFHCDSIKKKKTVSFLESVLLNYSLGYAVIMAQLLSPVCTDTLKFPNPLPNFHSRNQWSLFPGNNGIWSINRKRKVSGRVRVTSEKSSVSEDYADDYYAVLGLVRQYWFLVVGFCLD